MHETEAKKVRWGTWMVSTLDKKGSEMLTTCCQLFYVQKRVCEEKATIWGNGRNHQITWEDSEQAAVFACWKSTDLWHDCSISSTESAGKAEGKQKPSERLTSQSLLLLCSILSTFNLGTMARNDQSYEIWTIPCVGLFSISYLIWMFSLINDCF